MSKLKTTALRKSVTLYMIIAMFIMLSVIAIENSMFQKYHQNIVKENNNKQIHQSIEHVIQDYFKDYSNALENIIETGNIHEFIKNNDREGLYTFLKPKWEALKAEETNVAIMNITLSNGASFLRMHEPEHFGDQLMQLRPMMQEVYTSHKKISGYETGKHATVYRVISPIFDENHNYFGALELGLNPNFLVKSINEINGFSGMVFIKDESLKLYSKENDVIVDGYRLQSDLTPEMVIPKHLTDDSEVYRDGKKYRIHLFTLNDFKNIPKVKILFSQDITKEKNSHWSQFFGLFISILLMLIILTRFVYKRITDYKSSVDEIYKEQLRKLDESENRFRLLYEQAPIAYQSLDRNGNLLIVNAKWSSELGYTKEEVTGKNFSDFLTSESTEKFTNNFLKLKSNNDICNIRLLA